MPEPDRYPDSFDGIVELVLAGQRDAAGIVWDGTSDEAVEDVQADLSGDGGEWLPMENCGD